MPLTTQQKADQLAQAGYNGPTDPASVEAAYARTATPADQAANPSNQLSGGGGGTGQTYQTPNGTRTYDQIIQELQAANWDGQGNPVDVYNRTAAAGGGSQGAAPPPDLGGLTGSIQQMMQQIMGGANSADAQITKLMQALSATNEQDFQQRVSEFNQTHALALQSFGLAQDAQKFTQGLETQKFQLSQQQQQFQQGITTGGLTGTYQGQPTQAAKEFSQKLGEQGREFDITTARDLTDTASKLTGPADYFQFLNATNMGKSILGSLQSGQNRPAFGGETGQSFQPQSLGGIMSRLGIGGSAFGAQGIGSVGNVPPKMQQQGNNLQLPNNMGQLPLPHQINPAVWDSWGKAGQEFIKGAAASAGFDPNEFERQINATRPGTAQAQQGGQGATEFQTGGTSSFV